MNESQIIMVILQVVVYPVVGIAAKMIISRIDRIENKMDEHLRNHSMRKL